MTDAVTNKRLLVSDGGTAWPSIGLPFRQVEEVRRLAARPLSRTARQALGYKELLDALELGAPPQQALDAVVRRTRAYARRQLAWFRRDPRVRWSTLPPGQERLDWALRELGAAAQR